MYNRYSMQINDDEFAPVAAFGGPPERPGRPGGNPPAHPRPPHPLDPPHHHPHEPPPPPPHHRPPEPPHHHPPAPPPVHIPGGSCEGDSSILSSLKGILSNFHMPKLELDDLLLIAIAYLLLRESGDDDLILIIAALFVFGLFD